MTLHVMENQLTGFLPSSLGDLKKLTSLDLSNNRLEGSLPSELMDLRGLGRHMWG